MMRFLLLFFCLCSATAINAQQKTITIGKIDSIYSSILNEKRKVWVHVPYLEEREIFEKQNYPVVYLLDGEAGNFASVKTMIEQLSLANGNTVFPQMIVIGIQNTDRLRDLTPSHMASQPSSGGGEQFLSFLEKELIPHIDSLYPTAPYRIFIGHSLGGLTVINALLNRKELFNAYVAIDPAMWWDNQKLLRQAKEALQANSYSGTSLYLGIANTMEDGMDTVRAQRDTTLSTLMIRSNLALTMYLIDTKKNNNLNLSWKYYPEDDHNSVPLITEYDALRFIFKEYNLKLKENYFFDPSVKLDFLLKKQYADASKLLGYNVKPPGDVVNGLGNYMVMLNQFDKAEGLFKMNAANYSDTYNVYEALGDLYTAKGDKAKAIENFNKALAIKKTPELRKKLEALKSNK